MELFPLGRYFREKLGYFSLRSPSPSPLRLWEWNFSLREEFWGQFSPEIPISVLTNSPGMELFPSGRYFWEIIPRDLHLHSHQDSRLEFLRLGKYFRDNLGYYSLGSPSPSSPRLRGWNFSPWRGIWGKFGILQHFSVLPSTALPAPTLTPGMVPEFPGYPGGHLCHPHREAKLPSFPTPTLPGWDFPLPAPKAPWRGHDGGGTLGMFCCLSREENPRISDP